MTFSTWLPDKRRHMTYQEATEASHAEALEIQDGLNQTQREIERLRTERRGKIHGDYNDLKTNPRMIEDLRVQAWLEKDPREFKRLASLSDDEIVGLPDGWPDGVSASQYVDRVVESKRGQRLALLDADVAPAPGAEAPDLETASVKALREAMGQGEIQLKRS